MKLLTLTLLILFSFRSFADAECGYNMSISNATLEPLENSQVVQQNFTVSRLYNYSQRCRNYRVFFSKGFANNYQRRAFTLFSDMPYNLHKAVNQSGVLKEFNDALTSNEYLEGTSPDRYTTYSNSMFISTPGLASTVIRSGVYTDLVQATLYSYNENNGKYEYQTADNFTVMFLVSKKVAVSLIDEGGAYDASSTSKVMDFGILSQNNEKGVDLRVLSNGNYQIKLSSQNNGSLKLGSGESVSYALRVNGNNVSLSSSSSSPVQIGTGDMTSNAGDLYNLKVKITEDPKNKSAGMYQDILTITAIAN